MKKFPISIAFGVLIGIGLCTFYGCTSTPTVTTQPVVTQFPVVTDTPVVTQTPVVAIQTNVNQTVNPTTGVILVVTNTQLVTNYVAVTTYVPLTNYVPVTNYVVVTNTVYAANTNLINQIGGAASTINAVSTPINPAAPVIAPLIPWATALALALTTGVATFLNNKKQGIIQAIVSGVETAAGTGGTDATPVTLAAVKASVDKIATLNGVQANVNAAVQAITKK